MTPHPIFDCDIKQTPQKSETIGFHQSKAQCVQQQQNRIVPEIYPNRITCNFARVTNLPDCTLPVLEMVVLCPISSDYGHRQ